MHNPEFYKREKRRLSTYGVPRFVRCYHEDLEWLHLPRGLQEVVQDLVSQAGSRLEITDDRPEPSRHDFSFNAQLLPTQQRALDALVEHELGVLEAPPGAGKTVVGCALIAKTGLPALILVDRTTLLDQWRGQIETLLGVKPGQLGGGRRRRSGLVDLASLQTLARRDDLAELLAGYGLVIADECHHLAAATLERAVRQLPARRWLGLTATPYRSDGLDQMILMQCGPVRHRIRVETANQQPSAGTTTRRVLVHRTTFRYDSEVDSSTLGTIQDIYRALVNDDQRNTAIIEGVQDALRRGRHCLLLTSRTAHMEILAGGLREAGHSPATLHGKLGAKARRAAIDSLKVTDGGPPLLAVATGPYIGEGFDCPALDTIFLVFPVKFKGRVVQYVGRVVRPYLGKTSIEVHDYVDVSVPVLAYTYTERRAGYASLGFPAPLEV